MKCPQCQSENRASVKFCEECGAKFEIECPKCNARIPSGKKFCGECGHNLHESTAYPDYAAPNSYTPKHLADKILTSRSALEGERKLVTVLFADAANYTAMSEKLDPEEVHQIMDGCFRILMDEIHRYEGTINQFTGDGVMGLFGAPVAHEDHALRACHAALSIQKALAEYAEKIAKEYGISFAMRIGVNSGPVIVGAIGDDLRMDYTAVGDTTNLAARMQNAAKPGMVLISDHTCRLVKEYFDIEPIGKLALKGKEAPQEAFALVKAGKAATRLEASAAKGFTRFVGRENSMAALMEIYEKVKSGTGQVVGIVGEAGVGKSRLLLEFRNHLPQGEFTYLEGRCVHYGSAMPYLPIIDILRSHFDIREDEREVPVRKRVTETLSGLEMDLESALAPICDLLSLRVEDKAYLQLESKERKDRVFEALRNLLSRISFERPQVLAVEDLHWVDKTTEEFLDYFIRWMAGLNVMLVLLYRPEYTHHWGNKSYFNRIGVDQLGLQSSAKLVAAILESGEAAPELSEIILSRAAGNPLFMEELTHSLLENGAIAKEQDRYVLTRKSSALQVPDTVQGIIAARIDRLEENLKGVMQVAAVIGREFAFRILQAIMGMREGLKNHLLNLQGLEFIYEKSLFPELEYIFKHALTQEVAYNSLLSNRRKEIHKRIGVAIEELYPNRLEELYEVLAHHYTKGEDVEKAVFYLKRAGHKAVRNYAMWEAYELYKQALNLLETVPENEAQKKERLEVTECIMRPLNILGFPEGCFPIVQQGEKLAGELEDASRIVAFCTWMSIYYVHAGDHLAAIWCTEAAFEKAWEMEDVNWIVPLGFSLCMSYQGAGRFQDIARIAPAIIDLLENTKLESEFFGQAMNPYACICAFCTFSLGYLGRFKEGILLMEKGLHHAVQLNHVPTLAMVEHQYGEFCKEKGDFQKAIKHYERGIPYAQKVEWYFHQGLTRSCLGVSYFFLGSPETGRPHAEEGLRIYQESGITGYLSAPYLILSIIYNELGNHEAALRCGEEALRLSSDNNEKFLESWSLLALGKALWKKEPPQKDKAEASFLKALDIFRDLGMRPAYVFVRTTLAEYYLDVGMLPKVVESLHEAEDLAREMGIDYYLARACVIRAAMFWKQGEMEQAREKLSEAIALFQSCGADGWVKKCENERSGYL